MLFLMRIIDIVMVLEDNKTQEFTVYLAFAVEVFLSQPLIAF